MPKESTEKIFTFSIREVEEMIVSHLANIMSEHGNIVQFEWREDFEECAVIITVID